MDTKPTVTAKIGGKNYKLTWGKLALVRMSGIPSASRTGEGFAAIAQVAWASIAEIHNPFQSWEYLANEVQDDEWTALDDALNKLFEKPDAETAEKKSDGVTSGPLPA